MSISLDLGKILLFKKSNEGKIPLKQLLSSTIELLIFSFYLEVMFFKEKW